MWVLSFDGDENIGAFMAVFFKWFIHPEFGFARKVHHERVDDITIFIPMVRSCRIILATTRDHKEKTHGSTHAVQRNW